MVSRALDLEQHRLALMAAKGDVVSGRAAASWALFTYEKANVLKLLDSGAGGPDELARRFQSGAIMYGLCRLPDGATGQQHIVLISWVGERVSDQRRQACAGHLPAIRTFFKEANLVLKASQAEEVTQDGLAKRLSMAAPSSPISVTKKGPLGDPEEQVGTNYKKTNPALEILNTKRSSFWAQAEREEEERREEERRRAREERRRWERERMEEERLQAAERERRIQEKEQLIQEQRKLQAQRDEEERRSEEARRQQQQQQQQREQAKAPPEAGPRGRTREKEAATAREAPALAPQHTHSPRGFFQQRERSGSASEQPSSPGGRPGAPRRPFLRYQRSLTESAYIFQLPDPLRSPSSSLGDFLPSGSPVGASPRHPKPPPPPIGPKPGPGAHSPLPAPRTPTARTPPTLTAPPGSAPSGEAVATASPLVESTLCGTSGRGPPSIPSPELSSPPPLAEAGGPRSPSGPCRASALAFGSPPSQGPSLSDPHQAGEGGPCSPLGACQEEALPHVKAAGSSPRSPAEREAGQSRSCSAASPPTNGFLQEEGLATDDHPALAPSQAKLAPSSLKEVPMEDEGKCPKGHGLDMGGQVDSPAGANLPGTVLGGPAAGEGTRNGDRSPSVEGTEHDVDPKWQAAEA